MRRALIALALGCGCAPPTPAAYTPSPAGEQCYREADAAAERRAAAECPGEWDACPSKAAILDELKRAQERCPS